MHIINVVMHRFHHKKPLRERVSELRAGGLRIGFVPTMGALHSGHLSLVARALKENDAVVVSIFVNPTQFDNPEDLEQYPANLEEDLKKLRKVSDALMVFIPTANELYDGVIRAERFDFDGLEFEMEGKYRKGHFNGVATVVKKLFEAVRPHRAYFGEKDYQQLLIVKKLVKQEGLPVEITGCPIAREANGLAMSSRNERLPEAVREKAGFIYKALGKARERFETESAEAVKEGVRVAFEDHPELVPEYVEIANAETLLPVTEKAPERPCRIFIAVFAGTVRLIDNLALD